MVRKVSGLLATGLVAGTGFAGVAAAASQQATLALKASLDAKQQIPPQTYKASQASGHFTGTLAHVGSSGASKLTWHLAFAHLSSPVTTAYVLVPPSGGGAQFSIELCTRCASSATGVTEVLPANLTKAISTRTSYVLILTKKNPHGEIRGRMTVRR
jgi:hypothetical protein